MKKYKLYAIRSKGNFNYYTLDKNQEIVERLFKLFYETLNVKFQTHEFYINKKGKEISKKLNFNKLRDHHSFGTSQKNKSIRIDIICGYKKMFITIQCPKKLRLKFNETLFEFFSMPEYKHPKHVKEVKIKDKNKILGPFKINKYFLKKSKKK